jgi:hypothetical protein
LFGMMHVSCGIVDGDLAVRLFIQNSSDLSMQLPEKIDSELLDK